MRSQIEMPPGFRFHPTDDELVNHYLIRKCSAQSIGVPIIADIDLYKFDPWQLPAMALYGEKEWYFFSPRDRKYPNGSRPNRSAGSGYWKATGADKPIGRPKTLGIKKALVFYAGKASKGVKTNWIMHEYRLADVDRSAGVGNGKKNSRLDDWVLCRIYNKKGRIEKYLEESHDPELKPEDHISLPGRNMKTEPFDSSSSGSFPKMHTDSSSCSEHVLSPEVQSEPQIQWHQVLDEAAFDFQFDSLDKLLEDAMLMEPQVFQFPIQQNQASSFQDIFLPTSAELKTFY